MSQAWSFGALSAQCWPAPRSKARVLLCHGLGEHAGRYQSLIEGLNAAGYDAYVYDQRGHGNSAGPRALANISQLVEDHLAARTSLLGGTTPLFAFGHSLGGLVTALSAARDPRGLRGVVLSSPALELVDARKLPPLARRAMTLLGRSLPALPTSKLSPALLAQDQTVGQAYAADPLVDHQGVRAGSVAAMLQGADQLWPLLPRWRLPTLLVQGNADGIVAVEGARRFAEGVASSDLTYVEVPGGYHELFNDHTGPQLRETLIRWLDARTPVSRASGR